MHGPMTDTTRGFPCSFEIMPVGWYLPSLIVDFLISEAYKYDEIDGFCHQVHVAGCPLATSVHLPSIMVISLTCRAVKKITAYDT